jgi:dGTPase
MHKTQVFLAPEGDHYRTRLTHTLEVSQISRTVARILSYNEDLTEAVALGHDLGHTPFGHVGEMVLNKIYPGGFWHNEQSLRTVDVIEDTSKRRGLNLTYEVRDGILNHRGSVTPMTLEGQIVKICDRIAYVNHDIDDAVRSGVITMDQIPREELDILGWTHSERINNLIVDLCKNSEGKDTVSLSPELADSLGRLRAFMFANVYNNYEVRAVSDLDKVERIISSLYNYFLEHSDEIPGVYKKIEEEEGTETAVKDLISGMTDRYALNLYDKLFVPQGWRQL